MCSIGGGGGGIFFVNVLIINVVGSFDKLLLLYTLSKNVTLK